MIKSCLTFELLHVFYPEPQFNSDHFSIVLFCQFNPDPCFLLEEGMVQQDLYGIPRETRRDGSSSVQYIHWRFNRRVIP